MAHWSGVSTDEQARGDYGDLLAAARAHGRCRFWLIDLEYRARYADEFYQWYTHSFAPHAVRSLGHPVFIAYVTQPQQHDYRNDPVIQHLQQVCAHYDLHLAFFGNRPEALHWLQHQQEHDPAPGEGPAPLA